MTRPQIVRADTIDLQDHKSPSAKDHNIRQLTHSPSGQRNAPHHDQSIRTAERESLDEMSRVPEGGTRNFYNQDETDSFYEREELGDTVNGLRNDRLGQYGRSEISIDEDDMMDGDDDHLDDDLMDKISSSPSIDDEDIDFEFVYALHNFIATVEGQANASKGDTMVLLDDSNSYWWLVRVVKDGSIGYLPAEHIETPTERLARLNKHRNIDLSATMLGDNAEKSKNPLKKAMRRRNAKTVTFSPPTYFEASEVEYSTDEEDDDDQFIEVEEEDEDDEDDEEEEEVQATQKAPQKIEKKEDDMTVEPLRPKQHQQSQKESPASHEERPDTVRKSEDSQMSDDRTEFSQGRSRNGVVRNTDSFFKDDSVETKKISLTPNLLRDDSTNNVQAVEQKEMKTRGSFESFDKGHAPGDKSKDDRKRKDKKPGMLSGLFKRKDKKSKTSLDDDYEEFEKISEESTRSYTPPKTSIESIKEEVRIPPKQQNIPHRTPSKLQKVPPGEASAAAKGDDPHTTKAEAIARHSPSPVTKTAQNPTQHAATESPRDPTNGSRVSSPETHTKVAKSVLSDSSSDADKTPTTAKSLSPEISQSRAGFTNAPSEPQISNHATDDKQTADPSDRSDPTDPFSRDMATTDTISTMEEDHSSAKVSPIPSDYSTTPKASSPISSALAEDDRHKSNNTPSWNDAGLRAYLDDGSDIRDLLIIVHDKSNVQAAGPDHPITGNLFKDESKALNEMTSRLDDMLHSWLSRKALAKK